MEDLLAVIISLGKLLYATWIIVKRCVQGPETIDDNEQTGED